MTGVKKFSTRTKFEPPEAECILQQRVAKYFLPREVTELLNYIWVNSLIPKSDLHLISCYSLIANYKHLGNKNKRNGYQPKNLLIIKLILQVNTTGNVRRTVWRISLQILGWKGLLISFLNLPWPICQVARLHFLHSYQDQQQAERKKLEISV